MTAAQFARHAAHVLLAFGITLVGLLVAAQQPVTLDLVISLLPTAASGTLRGIEQRQARKQQPEAPPTS